jgi:hypothetical protein
VVLVRGALARVARIAALTEFDADAAADAVTVAETLLRADPSDAALQRIADGLGEAGGAMRDGRAAPARALLDRAAVAMTDLLVAGLPDAAVTPRPLQLDRLDGARADALRRPGGSQ